MEQLQGLGAAAGGPGAPWPPPEGMDDVLAVQIFERFRNLDAGLHNVVDGPWRAALRAERRTIDPLHRDIGQAIEIAQAGEARHMRP